MILLKALNKVQTSAYVNLVNKITINSSVNLLSTDTLYIEMQYLNHNIMKMVVELYLKC